MRRMETVGWALGTACLIGACIGSAIGGEPQAEPVPEDARKALGATLYNRVLNARPAGQGLNWVRKWGEDRSVAVAKVKASYLGVTTEPVNGALGKQLRLPEGIGLIVSFVEKDSPAEKSGVQLHDVLHKLNDQLLTGERHLLTLIRMHKPGDKIELTVIREAQPLKLSVMLIEKEVPPLEAYERGAVVRETPENTFFHVVANPLPGASAWGGAVSLSDKNVTVNINSKDGRQHLQVFDKDGKKLYEGDGDSKEMPDPVRLKIKGLNAWAPDVLTNSGVWQYDFLLEDANEVPGEAKAPPKTPEKGEKSKAKDPEGAEF